MLTKLIKDPTEFQAQLEEQIEEGRAIMDLPVACYETVTDVLGYVKKKYDYRELNDLTIQTDSWIEYTVEILKRSFNNPDNEYKREFECAVDFDPCSNDEVTEQRRKLMAGTAKLQSLIRRLPLIGTVLNPASQLNSILTNNIFIVHGHNETVKEKVARVLSKLGLNPIILHEHPDGGKTIIEKFEENSCSVSFAVVLLTSDDTGKANSETTYGPRARQNVILELGFFLGRLGRDRVFILSEEDVTSPSDMNGILYTPYDISEAWKFKLVKELNQAGYQVDANKLL